MYILITGVAGFIGSKIAKRFIDEGYKVIGIDNLSNGNIKNIPKEVDFINIDLVNSNSFNLIPSGCEFILHLAGQSSGELSYKNPIEDLKKNTISTLNLINYGIENKVKKFLFASSMSVYGDGDCSVRGIQENDILEPKSCYGIGKLSSEKYLKVFKEKLPFVSLRMFNVYGPGQDMNNMKQGMVSIFLSQAINYGEISIKGSLSRFRDFIFIDDVVESWFRATFYDKAINEAINIGTGNKTTVNELVESIKKITKVHNVKVLEGTPCDQSGIYADSTKLKKILDLNPQVKLENGLRIFHNWAKELKF